MRRQLIAVIEFEEFNLDGIESDDARVVSEYIDEWSDGDLSLGLPLVAVAYEVCDNEGNVQGIAFIAEDLA
ncbi:MAG: hypothetical protein H0W28_07485 [Pyrinomonadaceae bacterium]|nr:hypothetical protein [Pyrinomonadaceae bacterium]